MLYFFPGDLVLDEKTNDCCGKGTQQNYQFSPYDVLYLNNTYPLSNATLTPEQFTVKFFNDVFNQKVDAEDLSQQLQADKDAEKKTDVAHALQTEKPVSKMNAMKPEDTTAPVESKKDTRICYTYGAMMIYLLFFFLFLFVVFFLLWILVSVNKKLT